MSILINWIQTINLKTKINKVVSFDESQVAPRAFHAQCLYGEFLIISGGVDKNYHTQTNFLSYNFVKGYWNQLQITKIPSSL